MKTLSLRMTEPVRLETRDAAFSDDVGRTMIGIKNSFGTLSDDDVASITSILEKYSAGFASVTNATGVTRAGDGAHAAGVHAARNSAAAVRANIENNQAVGARYKSFWDGQNAELRASIRR